MPINDTVKTLNISITYQPLSMFKWQMYSAQQMRNRFNVMGNLMGEDEDEQDQDQKSVFTGDPSSIHALEDEVPDKLPVPRGFLNIKAKNCRSQKEEDFVVGENPSSITEMVKRFEKKF